MKKTVLFVRVSTADQNLERQVEDLQKYASSKGLDVIQTISEKVSGVVSNNEREGVSELIKLAQIGEIDKVLVTELSRLGRSAFEIITLINTLTELKVSVLIQDYNIETLDRNGKRQPMAEFLIYIISQIAQMERETLKTRIKSGMDSAKRKGVKIGRPEGSSLNDQDILNKYPSVVKDIKAGISIRKTAKIHSISPNTVKKIKRCLI